MHKRFLILVLGLAMLIAPVNAQRNVNTDDYWGTMRLMVAEVIEILAFNGGSSDIIATVGNSGDTLYIAPLIDVMYFLRASPLSDEGYTALENLTGLSPDIGWEGYFEWASENEIALPPRYDEFKGSLFTLIDSDFERFFKAGTLETSRVNMLEAVWGGVRVDGIPSLVNAKQISPEEAALEGEELTRFCRGDDCSYPAPDELVFGVYLDGDARAYPLRLLNWHEMFNDIIGHTPMYDAPDGEVVCNFRAPTDFTARGYLGDYVLIHGESAGCPTDGWLHNGGVRWADDVGWDTMQDNLPELTPEADALGIEEGYIGQVTGRPVMLAYCTLCGSGVLYDTSIDNLSYVDNLTGETVTVDGEYLEFGSSGLLMRSNKLMYDRATDTIWNALTGVPAFGALATTDIELPLLPVVVTDWTSWQEDHPDTSVLSLRTGHNRDYTNGAAYSDYFNDEEFIMFPVWQQDTEEIAAKDMVYGLRFGETTKAYPLDLLISENVTNDTVEGENVVLITRATPDRDFFEPGGAAVRAYASEDVTFVSISDDFATVTDDTGAEWQITENALISPDGRELERVAGQLAFWFGWYGFFPDTLVYGEETA